MKTILTKTKKHATLILAFIGLSFTTLALLSGCEAYKQYTGPSLPAPLPTQQPTNEQQRLMEVAQIRAAFPQAVGTNGAVDMSAVSNQLYNAESSLEKAVRTAQQLNGQVPNPYSVPIGAGLLIAGLVAQTLRHGRAQEEAKRLALLVDPNQVDTVADVSDKTKSI